MNDIDPPEDQNLPARHAIQTTRQSALCLPGFILFLAAVALAVHFTVRAPF